MVFILKKNGKGIRTQFALSIYLWLALATSTFSKDLDDNNNAKKFLAFFRSLEITESSNLGSGENFHIEPGISSDSKLGLKVSVKPGALNDPKVFFEILANIKPLLSDPNTQQALKQWAEIYWNSKGGDVEAKLQLKKWQLFAINLNTDQTKSLLVGANINADYVKIQNHVVDRVSELQSEIQNLEAQVKNVRRQANKSWESGEETRKQLETSKEKLDDLIKKNDRKGVRKTVEAFLPWDSMGTIEKNAWNQWLEAIENPATDPENTSLMFRGLDKENRLLRAPNGGHALIATILERNQGNYTRRLRSYRANRDRFGSNPSNALNANRKDSYGSISGSMNYHARAARGTPYVSFSNLYVADLFSTSGTVAVRIDKRRILPNFMNTHAEFEMLVPLIVFPDEIIHISEYPQGIKPPNHLNDFRAAVETKLGRAITSEEFNRKNIDGKLNFKTESFNKYLDDFVRPYQEITAMEFRPPTEIQGILIDQGSSANGNSDSKKPGFFGKMITGCKNLFSLLK